MKKALSLLLILVLMFTLVTGCSPKEEVATTEAATTAAGETTEATEATEAEVAFDNIFVNIGTGGTAGTYFPLGGAFAEIWNNNYKRKKPQTKKKCAKITNKKLIYVCQV